MQIIGRACVLGDILGNDYPTLAFKIIKSPFRKNGYKFLCQGLFILNISMK